MFRRLEGDGGLPQSLSNQFEALAPMSVENLHVATAPLADMDAAARSLGPPLIPLLIGAVGKREIGTAGGAIETAIHDLLVELRRRHPCTPIFVLTALAEGADWCAARAAARFSATQRAVAAPPVRIVCPLPLKRGLYQQDFSDAHSDSFAQLLDACKIDTATGPVTLHPNDLLVFELRPLQGAEEAEMTRVGGRSRPHRTLHYEQAGLYIADACHLLIGVMPKEEVPTRVGGTARIVQYKCTGSLPPEPLELNGGGFNHLVAILEKRANLPSTASHATHDLATHRLKRLSLELPEPLPPAGWFSRGSGHVWHLMTGSQIAWRYLKGAQSSDHAASMQTIPAHRGEIFALTQPYEAFNKRVTLAHNKGWLDSRYLDAHKFGALVRTQMGTAFDPVDHEAFVKLSVIRGTIAELQRLAKTWADLSLWVLAALFVATVAAFTHFKVWHGEEWAAYTYMFLLVLAAGWYTVARYFEWSAIHDDYRAAAEALRVQIGWRLAGIRERVERHYRAGSTQQLERVRLGIKTVNTVIAIEHRPTNNVGSLGLLALARKQWINGQCHYFNKTRADRHRQNERHLSASMTLFSLGVGLFLSIVQHMLHIPLTVVWPWFLIFAPVALLAFVMRFRGAMPDLAWFRHVQKWIDMAEEWIVVQLRLRRWLKFVARLYPLVWFLFPCIVGLWLGATIFDAMQFQDSKIEVAKWLGLAVALLNASAAAGIYLREKLAIEPEERNYEQMTRVFLLADDLLSRTDDPSHQRSVLAELGREALGENAYWLRAHRERPIEQIPG